MKISYEAENYTWNKKECGLYIYKKINIFLCLELKILKNFFDLIHKKYTIIKTGQRQICLTRKIVILFLITKSAYFANNDEGREYNMK